MNPKFDVNSYWFQKAFILLAFFGCLSARKACAGGLPPFIIVPPVGATVYKGDTVTFTATIGFSYTPLTISWNLNGSGKNIPHATVSNVAVLGTTISTLTITNAVFANAGNYRVAVTNGGGGVVSGNALLTILTPLTTTTVSILTQGTGLTNGGFQLNLLKPASSNCVIEATSNFQTWTPLYTNSSGYTNISYLDSAATNLPLRYYRARLQ